MKNRNILAVAVVFTLLAKGAFAWFDHNAVKAKPIAKPKDNAAECAPATARTQLQLNNVRALIETGGSLWQDRATSSASYEVPKNSGHTAIYAGALWMGGVDVNGQLKLAGVQFRQGNDFWTGPLTIDPSTVDPGNNVAGYGAAEITASECSYYDQHYIITKQEVEIFNAWYLAGVFDEENPPANTQAESFPAYSIPEIILSWPAHGNTELGQDFYLAPFYDRDGDGVYNPGTAGDYPWYDLENDVDCNSASDRRVTLFGDQTLWWVFNDKGNIHTETGGDAIGMEIHAQAFAFATNDEVNNMTFYNYELINRGTFPLFETYFCQWVDADVGGAEDDYVGCDVNRGLGYAYNGDAFDGDNNGAIGYGANPPAIGVDFFEGPFQDNDGIDNAFGIGPDEALNGIGFGDGITDNERYGMRRFLYYDRLGAGCCNDPNSAVDYYNYMRSIWKDNTKMVYGGNGHIADPASDNNLETDFMFPGDTDPLGWGQGGTVGAPWTEQTAGNLPSDRRFLQSAGPFKLDPGQVNNITVGVVYARASAGDPFASVEAMRVADDKAQALFENCFKVLDGPDAPELAIQELDRELIITLSNSPNGNNPTEEYFEVDPFIPESITTTSITYVLDTATGQYDQVPTTTTEQLDRLYRFQGYQIYQVKNDAVGPSDLQNVDLAALVAQCDLKDGVTQIINYNYSEELSASVPVEMVFGADVGISHSFRITDDRFAQGDRRLINHKNYYFMAIAYGYNNYKSYDPNDGTTLDGQKFPYKAGRKSASGAIRSYNGIPHIPSPELGGTVQNSQYGDGPQVTRIEGQGNGRLILDLTAESEAAILASSSNKVAHPVYKGGAGPVDVKVIDPLNVPDAVFEIVFERDSNNTLDNAVWTLTVIESNDPDLVVGTVSSSDRGIEVVNEQLFPEYGISVKMQQYQYTGSGSNFFTELLEATMEFADSSQKWLTGVVDVDGFFSQNWIRSGTSEEESDNTQDPDPIVYNDYIGIDDDQVYENVLGGWWAPWRMVAKENGGPVSPTYGNTITMPDIADIQSVDLVITSDESLWTRCAIIEMQDDSELAEEQVAKSELRSQLSVGKDFLPDGTVAPGGGASHGMGWFPGYAINLETGERLNMAFGEDSWLAGENGRDMQWNPSDRDYTVFGTEVFAGKHYIYIFNNQVLTTGDATRMPEYDNGVFLEQNLSATSSAGKIKVWRSMCWVGLPMVVQGETFMSNDVRIRLRAAKPYDSYDTGLALTNGADPVYQFGLGDLATTTTDLTAAEDALDLINIVPNPYYAYSAYEENRLDNRVKVTNLPDICTVRIYTIGGTLIRTYRKDSPITSIDWDLKNQANVPIAGGVYLIHVDVPDVGEKVIKWFGALRPVDLENF
jgi:hypothetical protein